MLLIGQWRVDKLQWRAYILLMDDRYCSINPQTIEPVNTEKSPVWFAVGDPGKSHLQSWPLWGERLRTVAPLTRTGAAAERLYAKTGLPQLEACVRRWQLAPTNTDPCIDQRLVGVTTASFLCLSQSLAAKYGAPSSPEKNVGCRCWLSDQHADEETFYLRARDSGVTCVHAHAHVGAVPM